MTLNNTSTMRALVLDSYETALFRETVLPRPAVGEKEVLVRIVCSGVNPIDYKIRTGVAPYAMPELPAVLGTDMAGIVEAIGPGVVGFAPGDAVFGLTGGVRGLQGSLAEYAAVDADLLALKPRALTMQQAAATPLVALTAWEGLIDKAGLRAGQTVLITGGSGGVGHAAIQIALAKGAHVFATARGRGLSIVADLGATPIDSTAHSVMDYVEQHTAGKGFGVVYDTVGGTVLDDAFHAVRANGHVTSCAAFGTHLLAPASLRAASISGVFVLLPMLSGAGRARHGSILKEIASLAEAGLFQPIIDPRRFTLETAAAAHDAVEGGGARVKVVIDVSEQEEYS